MITWEELVVSALLGTERRPPPRTDGRLEALESGNRETVLLRQAAAFAIMTDAGRRPVHDAESPPQPCPPDVVPRVGEEAGSRLGRLLAGEHALLLGEWLALASAAGRRVPEELLPGLLDLGRPDVLPVLGERGRWLATRDPRWSWVRALEEPEASWPTADLATRRLILSHLRATNPALGRRLLASAWQRLPPDDRAGLLPLLSDHLSLSDVPLLEQARRARRIDVRAVAAELLSFLPASTFATEAAAAAARFLRVGAGGLSVSLPARARDIEPVPARRPPRGRGRGTRLLEQVLAHGTLRAWEAPRMTPRRVVQMALTSEYAGSLTSGWATAAIRQRDEAWASALVDAGVDRPGLVSVIAPEEAVSRVLHRLAADGITAGTLALLEAIPGDWPDSIGRRVLAALRRTAVPRSVLIAIAVRLNPDLAAEAAATLPSFPFAPLTDVLAFRRDMRMELT